MLTDSNANISILLGQSKYTQKIYLVNFFLRKSIFLQVLAKFGHPPMSYGLCIQQSLHNVHSMYFFVWSRENVEYFIYYEFRPRDVKHVSHFIVMCVT